MAVESDRPRPDPHAAARGAVQRQIKLPLSKAVEIAWKNIRLRIARSLVVVSGIVLALAFLMSIRINEAILDGMRSWIGAASQPDYPPFQPLRDKRAELEGRIASLEGKLRPLAAEPPKLPAGRARMVAREVFGKEAKDLRDELQTGLPGPEAGLLTAASADPQVLADIREWIATYRQLNAVRRELNGPRTLESMMAGRGVAVSGPEVEKARVQTRWVLSLALLVAFVGILNAMLMSVTERFREIGTMKCLGALDTFIVKLFLIESLFQGAIGTAVGIVLGLALSLASNYGSYHGYIFKQMPFGSVMTSIGLCLLVGVSLTVMGAVYPAWKAARMAPIEAMRVEA